VDVGTLASLFADTTNSYKYFFFLSILDRVERAGSGGEASLDRPIPLDGLAVDMVLGAWYPHGFCRLSLGGRDMLQKAVDGIKWGSIRGSWIVAGGEDWRRLRAQCVAELKAEALTRFVPYRLIRPFFAEETRGLPDHAVNERVAFLADKKLQERKPLYCFTADRAGIILQHDWIEYLGRNAPILRGWARFHLAGYLQARNPNVAGIVEKLEPPIVRASLAKQTAWWRQAIPLLGERARCIYSGERLSASSFSLDHYLPWSFVAHDRLWNLVPTSRGLNASKSDRLPAPRYLNGLATLQHAGIVAMKAVWTDAKWTAAVEPWLVDFKLTRDALLDVSKLGFAYQEIMEPLLGTAGRAGFPTDWILENQESR
jgi:hypothetical protein